jgi:hypothetical protein
MSSMIQFPLDLPDVEVLKTEVTAAGHLLITVESTLEGARCLLRYRSTGGNEAC